ncbi:iron-sulfur assembly protein [Histoplasma capsulatum G186AR]|uniref:Iron-sulfur assembly protein 1 n=1 Tax=Ajellomyces capsulatus TaxID=5037 RepID=A0A8H7YZY5_AJECA|nr:iron-sulfur assembly protein [Histoplasma capsulatum]QSS67874.1 iron-sulfur assembly protein [Histoplasma capsulatum G186AR]
MSFCSALHPTVTSSGLLRSVTTKLPRRAACPLSLRSFSSYGSSNHSSKRKLQTATAYQPYSLLESLPPPARNSDSVSEASIVVDKNSMLGKWQSGSTNRPHPQPQQPESVESINKSNATSYPEVEAQVSKLIAPSSPSPSVSATPSATATTTPPTSAQSLTPKKTRRVSKLKARKTAMHITPEAILHLRQLTDQPDPKLVRVGVKNRGCSGLSYHLEYVDKPAPFDEVVEQDGVKILIDSKALFSIIGTEMDWQEDSLASRFVFKNPNIKDQCGCGESFMV